MTPSPDWTSGLPPCFYESRRPFRVMRKTCARLPATAFHPSVCHRGGANTSHQESEGVGAMRGLILQGTRQALLDSWSPYARCVLHPAIYLSSQRCPPALENPPGQILQYRLLCVLQEPGLSIRSHLLTSSVLRLFPYLLPCPLAEIRTQVVLRLALPGWGVASAPGAFPCSYNANLSG